ncbi:WASH complex subunit 3 isoform X2 [Aphidius gifuensis]|uniref:WASH complex subunit 3 isoform X2 n=1 Tax=Aphidius gifuensis TaxID=684658 RepID=UPI001CDBE908|nr:WASH complex subunit 3 isoform X2 [Aphidius gifuensis]
MTIVFQLLSQQLTTVPPIHQKRIVSFINHFVVNTVTFLNKFALNCEEKLYEFENKLQKIEAALVILESRLASVPGLEEKIPDTTDSSVKKKKKKKRKDKSKNNEKKNIKIDNKTDKKISEENNEPDNKVDDEPGDSENDDKPITEKSNLQPINKHPVYEKFFKMINFGVPKPAVQIKMTQEGLDPSLLDDPTRLIPQSADTPQES